MSKKKKRTLKHKQIKKTMVKEVKLTIEPVKVEKRKYHHKRKYVSKQPIASIIQVEQLKVEYPITIDKQQPIQFDIIPKKLIYAIIIAVMVIPISIGIIVVSIPPEPVIVNSDGSYLAIQVN